MDFENGDKVIWHDQEMTVHSQSDHKMADEHVAAGGESVEPRVRCTWVDEEGRQHEGFFHPDTLKLIPPPEPVDYDAPDEEAEEETEG